MSKDKAKIEVKRDKPGTVPAKAEPWSPLMNLRSEIDRLFDDFGGGLFRHPFATGLPRRWPMMEGWEVSPAMELVECDGSYSISAELPGIAPENIEIKLSDGMITIRGEKSEEKKEEKEDYLLNERRYGEFQRSLPLPAGIDAEAVTANVSNGVLTVTLPKTVEAKQKERKVEVKAA